MPINSVNGVQLFLEQTGERGAPLVLVHGSWGDHHNWDAVVPALSKSFRVVTYDRRGHSRSERPSAPGSIEDDVVLVGERVGSHPVEKAEVLGDTDCSEGARIREDQGSAAV